MRALFRSLYFVAMAVAFMNQFYYALSPWTTVQTADSSVEYAALGLGGVELCERQSKSGNNGTVSACSFSNWGQSTEERTAVAVYGLSLAFDLVAYFVLLPRFWRWQNAIVFILVMVIAIVLNTVLYEVCWAQAVQAWLSRHGLTTDSSLQTHDTALRNSFWNWNSIFYGCSYVFGVFGIGVFARAPAALPVYNL
jgi:hypothetical protein